MSDLAKALFDFKDKIGPLGHLSNKLLVNMASQPDDHLTYQRPLSISTIKARIAFVEEGAKDYFTKNDITPMDLEPLQHGGESLVFNCNNGHVLKLRTGESYKDPRWRKMVHASKIGYSQELNVTYGIYPEVETKKATPNEFSTMCFKAMVDGYHITDANLFNFGLVKKGSKKVMHMIDDGAVIPIRNIRQAYHAFKTVCAPVYDAMPFIHPVWRGFRDNVKFLLGWPKPEQHKNAPRIAIDK